MILQRCSIFLFFAVALSVTNAREIDWQNVKGHTFSWLNGTQRYVFLKDNGLESEHHNVLMPQLRIVNGLPASRGQFCYMAYIQLSDGYRYWSCGGSLVTPTQILTAAHCVQGAISATVVLGALDLKAWEPGRLIVQVPQSGLKVHENYDSNTVYNDIALITMKRPVKLSDYVCTVNLPSCSSSNSSADPGNSNFYTVSGWGLTSDNSRTSRLMYVSVGGESPSSCAKYYLLRADYQMTKSQICTSGSGGASTCNGDSGGPLVQKNTTGALVQEGIVSLGMSSCETSAPSVYTGVRFFISWICPKLIK